MSESIQFTVPLPAPKKHPELKFLGANGRPSAEPFQLTLRLPDILDAQNITRSLCELAARLQSDGEPDPLAHADMLAGRDMLAAQLRHGVAEMLYPEHTRQAGADKLTNFSIGAGVALVHQIAAGRVFRRDVERLLADTNDAADPKDALSEADFPLAVDAVHARFESAAMETDQASRRRLFATRNEVDSIDAQLEALERCARWSVLSTLMPPEWRRLDHCPGWQAYGVEIVTAWRLAEDAALRDFTTPSAS